MPTPAHLPFAVTEYLDRRERVRSAMRERHIDLLLVSSPANLFYLCGYEASWYPPRLPVVLAISVHDDRVTFFDWARHRDHVEHTTLADEAVYYEYGDGPAVIAKALGALGPCPRVGVEWTSPSPSPDAANAVAAAIVQTGRAIVAADWLVDQLRLYKSPAEVDRVRQAARIADEVILRLQASLRPGLSELEVSAMATTFLAEGGSEIAAMSPLVSSGPTAWRDVHAFPSRRKILKGELVSIDVAAVVDRYHVNLSRVFSLGARHAVAERWLEASRLSLKELLREARVGFDPSAAMARAEEVLRQHVPGENIWWTGGYSLGIAFPPSWVGHGYLANDGPTAVALEEGYVSNFESILYDRDRGFEVAPIDSVLMTGHGLECLSSIPRELLVVGTSMISEGCGDA